MWSYLPTFLQPPHFADDALNRTAGYTYRVIWLFVFVTTVRVLGYAMTASWQDSQIALVVLLITNILFLGLFPILAAGYVQTAGLGAVLINLGLYTLSYATTYGIYSATLSSLATLILLSGLVLGQRGLWLFTLINMGVATFYWLSEQQGWLVIEARPTATEALTAILTQMFMIAFMTYLYEDGTDTMLKRTRASEQALAERNEELQQIQATLQEQINIRTQRAEQARYEAEQARQEIEEQAWLSAGQAKLSEKMRGEQEVEELANQIIQFICHYIEAEVGTIYLSYAGGYQLTGRYAYLPPPYFVERFQPGEGVVGQVALENRPVLLNKIETDEMVIASGLGDTIPKQTLTYPIAYNGRVVGVLECGTLGAFLPRHLTFLAHVNEGIAVAFITAQTRTQINQLLPQSK